MILQTNFSYQNNKILSQVFHLEINGKYSSITFENNTFEESIYFDKNSNSTFEDFKIINNMVILTIGRSLIDVNENVDSNFSKWYLGSNLNSGVGN